MTAANETFAVALLGLVIPPEGLGPLVRNGRPDFDAMDAFEQFASTGERRLLVEAQEAWVGKGFTRTLSCVDAGKRAEVISALTAAYAPVIPSAPAVMPGQLSLTVDDLCDLCDEPPATCGCDNCVDCGAHFMRCTCGAAA